MKKSLFAIITTFSLILSAVSFSFAKTADVKKDSRQTNQLVAQLPASDVAVTIDMQKLMKDALPQILSSKAQMLADVNAQLDNVKNIIGIDLRQFDRVAAGLMMKKNGPKQYDLQPLVLARGTLNVASLVELAKTAAKDKYREEKEGAKTIYVFSAKELLLEHKPALNNPKDEADFNKMLAYIPKEIGVVVLSDNTLAVGMPARVHETVAGKSHLSSGVLGLVNRNQNSIISFGGNLPENAAQFFNLDDDEIGRNVNLIKQAYGGLDVNDGSATLSVVAKTLQAQQATDLQNTVEGLRMLGVSALGMAKGDDQKVYARWAQNAKITRNNNEVALTIQVPQSDINALLNKK